MGELFAVKRKPRNSFFSVRGCSRVVALFVPLLAVTAQEKNEQERFIQVTAGIGVDGFYAPTINDYINALTIPAPSQKLFGFTSASEFFVALEVQVAQEWSVGIEYSYFLKSYSAVGSYPWDFSYSAQLPTLLVHYLIPGEGYWLKCGGGVGYAFGNMTEKYLETGAQENFTAAGPTFKVDAVGNTEFDAHFWGSIGVDLRWVSAGSFNVSALRSGTTPKLDFFDAGVKFGVTVAL